MRISIVTISFNQDRFLKDAINSIVSQGYSNLEYVVVDPGSTDGSRNTIAQYGDHISKSILEPDAGPADGLNKGFACTSGEILGFVNADDELLPNSLQFVADYFDKHPDVDVLLGCGRIVDERGSVSRHIVPSRFSLEHYAFGRFEFIQQAVFFRRSIFESIGGFNVSNRISWDGELLVDMAVAGARFARSERELGAFRIYPSSISGRENYMQNLSVERARLFRKVTGRDPHWFDPLLGLMLLASKWILDPWYVGWRLSRNLHLYVVSSSVKSIFRDYVKPILRPALLKYRLFMAYAKVMIPLFGNQNKADNFVFIIGCGRSGTTILGDILSIHPDVRYFFEPWHLWRVVDKRTDVLHLFSRQDSHLIMGAESYTTTAQHRFRQLFINGVFGKKIHIEKTPHNAMRIGYLETLVPNAKYIHIVRDGVDVALSVEELIRRKPYKLAFRKQFNLWWGEASNKWNTLKDDGVKAGYFPSEVGFLSADLQKGAYEWLVSLAEIDRHREQLGDRFLEIRYADLVNSPVQVMEQICDFVGAGKDIQWMNKAMSMLRSPTTNKPQTIELPPEMSEAFNRYQEEYGFAGRAIP